MFYQRKKSKFLENSCTFDKNARSNIVSKLDEKIDCLWTKFDYITSKTVQAVLKKNLYR